MRDAQPETIGNRKSELTTREIRKSLRASAMISDSGKKLGLALKQATTREYRKSCERKVLTFRYCSGFVGRRGASITCVMEVYRRYHHAIRSRFVLAQEILGTNGENNLIM